MKRHDAVDQSVREIDASSNRPEDMALKNVVRYRTLASTVNADRASDHLPSHCPSPEDVLYDCNALSAQA